MPTRPHPVRACALSLLGSTGSLPLVCAPPDELTALLNIPIQAASRRVERLMDSPQAVEVLTAQQIRASGAFRLVDVLRLATSLQVWDKAPARANVTLRGINPADMARTLQVLVDGVPLFNFTASPIDFNGLPVPLDAIDRIEIIRGPSSSLYGANAQFGVIAIYTRRMGADQMGDLRLGVREQGTQGQAFYGVRQGPFSLTAAGGYRRQAPAQAPFPVVGFPTLEVSEDLATRERQCFVRPELKLPGGAVWFAYGYGESGPFAEQAYLAVLAAPSPSPPGISTTFPGELVVRHLLQVGWRQTWSPHLQSEGRLQEKAFRLVLSPLQGLPQPLALLRTMDPAVDSRRDFYSDRLREASLQLNWDPAPSFHLVGGVDAKQIITGENLTIGLSQPGRFHAHGIFLSVDGTLGPLTLSGGLRAASETLGGASLSPRLSILWHLAPGSVLRGGWYTSTRSPTVQEKYSSQPGLLLSSTVLDPSQNLESEGVTSWELGYRRQAGTWSMEATLFRSLLKDFIVRAPTGELRDRRTVLRYQNLGASHRSQGIELSVAGRILEDWHFGFNAALQQFRDPIYGRDAQADLSPRQNASLWVRCRWIRTFFHLALQHVGPWTAANTYRTPTGGTAVLRTQVDASLQLHFNAGWEPTPGWTLSLYGLQAGQPVVPAGSQTLTSALTLRASRREVGLQTVWQF